MRDGGQTSEGRKWEDWWEPGRDVHVRVRTDYAPSQKPKANRHKGRGPRSSKSNKNPEQNTRSIRKQREEGRERIHPKVRDEEAWCEFHQAYGHATSDCKAARQVGFISTSPDPMWNNSNPRDSRPPGPPSHEDRGRRRDSYPPPRQPWRQQDSRPPMPMAPGHYPGPHAFQGPPPLPDRSRHGEGLLGETNVIWGNIGKSCKMHII